MSEEKRPHPSVEDLARAMPKVELHVHLEGSADPETVFAIAERNGLAPPAATVEDWRSRYAFTDFGGFLDAYLATAAVLRTADDYAHLCTELVARQAEQGVAYTEAFLSGSIFPESVPDGELLDALSAAAAAGERETGSRIRFIPDVARHLPHTQRRVLDFAIEGHERGIVVGIGLGGPEVGYPTDPFEESYRAAGRAGLRLVAHAGETDGASSVRGVIEGLRVERIGHGVRILEDAALVERAREAGIVLEVSPTSNYRLGVVPAGEPHPIRRLVDAGLRCTVNSDDPALFGTSLTEEFLLLHEQGFSWPELWQLNRNALDAAFLDPPERDRLAQRWNAFEAQAGL